MECSVAGAVRYLLGPLAFQNRNKSRTVEYAEPFHAAYLAPVLNVLEVA